jgi:hypothetical protein
MRSVSQNRTRTDAREVAASGWIVTDIDTCEDITAVDPKRRLPMLQSKDEGDSPPRPRWEWIGFGAIVMVVAWLPLAGLAAAIIARWHGDLMSHHASVWSDPDWRLGMLGSAVLLLPALSIVLSCVFGGYLLGRWGKRGPSDAALSAAFAILFGIGLAWARFGVTWEGLVALLLAMPSAILGSSLGGRRRGGAV